VDRGRIKGLSSNRFDAAYAIFFGSEDRSFAPGGSHLEALETTAEAEAWVERSEERGVFLAPICANGTGIEASFCTAIRIAKEQKSVSLQKRAEATYAEYHRQKASGSEDVDSDYLFANSSSFLPKVRLILPLLYVVKLTFLELHLPTLKPLNFPLQTPNRP